MQTFHETSDLARAANTTESRVRRLIRRGVIVATGKTVRGTLIFADEEVARAREKLQQRRPS